jgi:hypothetical protein
MRSVPGASSLARGRGVSRRSAPSLRRLSLAPLLALAATLLLGAASASAAAPVVTIEPASSVHFTTAHVEGEVDPADHETSFHFEYVTQAQFESEGEFAAAGPNGQVAGFGSAPEGAGPTPAEATLENLAPNTTYHLRLVAENGETAEAIAATFTTKAVTAPALTIEAASAITYHSAHASGTVALANEDPAFNSPCAFQYITEEAFEQNILNSVDGFEGASTQPCEPETVLGTESQPVAVKADLGGLAAGTTYHLRLVAANLGGNSTALAANFETESVNPPSASALAVSAITATSAHFSATVNSGGSGPGEQTATYSFSCEPACPGLAPQPIPADGSDHVVEETATGLEPNTSYTVTLTAESPGGKSTASEPFATEVIAPTVATLPFVGPVSPEAARLYGTVNPHNSATTYFFEYGPTDAYGTSVPLSEDAEVPPGNSAQTVSQDLTGLSPTTTYHYRIVAESPAGTEMGQDQTLTTAKAPEACSAAEQQLRSENNSTGLPNCLAYERVTPAFKSGSGTSAKAISADGSRVVSESTGLFAGSQGGSLTAEYESLRTPSGWSTEALDPPSSLFPAQELADVSADLGQSLWEVRRPTESLAAENLALRKPGGSFLEVGPMLPPSVTAGPPAGEAQQFADDSSSLFYAGSTANLSHIFFQVQELLWPGDTTQSQNSIRSLYEYTGTANIEPQLVGISDEGTPATIAASHLISDCGTALGSISGNKYNADIYNAVSQGGETVFFTAAGQGCGESHAPEASELFARVGSGAGAHTVAISEPSSEDCQACQTAPVAAAEFQGASRDGTKAFFLTEQGLLEGAEGENLYSYDFANPAHENLLRVSTGAPGHETTKPDVLGVARVSQDGSHVYFVARGVLAGANAEGNSPTAGRPNLYLFERDAAHPAGRTAFVATLSEADNPNFGGGCFEGDWCPRDARPVQATPDGRFLVFQSRADLTPGDTSSAPQVFEYDAQSEELVRVSVGEPGYPAGAQAADERGATIPTQEYVKAMKPFRSTTGLAVSADGSLIEFSSTGGLTEQTVAAGAAGLRSVFEYRSAGLLSNGRVVSVSNGSGQFGASATGIDTEGTDAFFETVAPVLASDRDGQVDLYDTRDNGGFPAPAPAPHCEGEGCQGTPSSAPSEPAPATPGFHGSGNLEEKPCKKGFVRRHGHCVKRHAKKHTSKHKRANANRRVSR